MRHPILTHATSSLSQALDKALSAQRVATMASGEVGGSIKIFCYAQAAPSSGSHVFLAQVRGPPPSPASAVASRSVVRHLLCVTRRPRGARVAARSVASVRSTSARRSSLTVRHYSSFAWGACRFAPPPGSVASCSYRSALHARRAVAGRPVVATRERRTLSRVVPPRPCFSKPTLTARLPSSRARVARRARVGRRRPPSGAARDRPQLRLARAHRQGERRRRGGFARVLRSRGADPRAARARTLSSAAPLAAASAQPARPSWSAMATALLMEDVGGGSRLLAAVPVARTMLTMAEG